ncbi:MAG TPA: DUF3109 family protein [Chitinophagaceae bacterium]|nr:DUF3109 family protein [Chitinophagaceae bacterium]MCB9055332.1 DUF3109 family protein [Chitinophagales bacterium]HPG12001.1 DUF3109 family protein [Chitinophagaceae bacterium]HRX92594.1 DUF3109 family protein [Chitinophagaceae bacterium]
MIVIDNILISEEIVEKRFVCDLSKCKGGCCEDGAAGAPLEKEEMGIINDVFEKVKAYLTADAIAEIGKKGKYVYDTEFEWVTPTLDSDNEICVYGSRDKNGIIKCAFEQAYNDGVIQWKKPISCHLYPMISKKGKHGDYERVNYEPRENLCSPACSLGEELKVPVYQFLKEPIIRKYGEEFYEALDTIAKGEWEEIDFKE